MTTLVIVLGAGWLLIVGSVIAMFRIAARSDEVLPSAIWQAGPPMDDEQPAPGGSPVLGRSRRRLYAVDRP